MNKSINIHEEDLMDIETLEDMLYKCEAVLRGRCLSGTEYEQYSEIVDDIQRTLKITLTAG